MIIEPVTPPQRYFSNPEIANGLSLVGVSDNPFEWVNSLSVYLQRDDTLTLILTVNKKDKGVKYDSINMVDIPLSVVQEFATQLQELVGKARR